MITKPPRQDPYATIQGMDPRADWLLGPGIQDYLPYGDATLIPFVMNLHDEAGVALVGELREGGSPIYISPIYRGDLGPDRYFTAWARKDFFDELAKVDGEFEDLRKAPKEIQLCAPGKATSIGGWEPGGLIPELEEPPVAPPAGGWRSGTVVIGIIDDGIAFANERFRTDDGKSRVQCFWRQDPPDTSGTVAYGAEICKEGAGGIDDLLWSSATAGSLDEDLFYRRAGLIDHAVEGHKAAALRVAHGTHILDLAAGADLEDDVVDRPIIAVQLETAVTADTSGAGLENHLIEGVEYILQRADAIAGGVGLLPVVINFSYGLVAGPHDGTSPIERMFDQRIGDRGDKLRVVLPAGNSHLSRCHAKVSFGAVGETVELLWRVQPDDRTPSFVEIWLPHEGTTVPAASRIEVSVVKPDGSFETTPLGESDGTSEPVTNDGEDICVVRYRFVPWPTERGLFRIELQPTTRLHPTPTPAEAKRIAPSGVWTIKLRNLSLPADQVVHAWIQRDDTPYGYPRRGRQSYFDHPCYIRFDSKGREIEEDTHPEQAASPCEVKRESLVNAIATGTKTIVAGGYHRKDFHPAKYSAGEPIIPARGGSPDPNFRKPDAMLVSEDSKVHRGVLAAGSRSGARVALNGTSVAAPQLTREIANKLAGGDPGDRNTVKMQAQAEEASPGTLPANRGGWGRMLRNSAFPRERYWD